MSEPTDSRMQYPQYLGDGVYAGHDSAGQVWLAVNDHRNIVVALEPSVLAALVAYATRHGFLRSSK